jgi:hypothetical protein
MQPIVMKVALFRGDFDQARSQYSLLWLMEALTRINQSHIRQFRSLAKQGKVPAPYPMLYRAGVHYEPEPGTEEWIDIPTILSVTGGTFPGAWGDCLPTWTSLIKKNGGAVPMYQLKAGDEIIGDWKEDGIPIWTTVNNIAFTGDKTIIAFMLENDQVLYTSPEHRLFDHHQKEIRAEKVKVEHLLLGGLRKEVLVTDVHEMAHKMPCCDITTSIGRFWLPQCDVVVHNCEDLACWRTAELREQPKPVKAKPFAKWRQKPDGAYAYHALVLLPDGRLEDPSLVLGMGNEPEFARLNMAHRYKEGSMTPTIRYAKKPDVVVVDSEHPKGVSKDIKGAKARTGLIPPPGSPVDGLVTGRMPTQTQSMFPEQKGPVTSDEDGSIYASIQGDDVAAWGYDRSQVNRVQMTQLMKMTRRKKIPY